MKCATVTRALIVRLCFACHGLISIYLLYNYTYRSTYWYLAIALAGLFFESMVTLVRKRGHEWKWFCPSVFFYLFSVVPAIWCFEMELFDFRALAIERCIKKTEALNLSSINSTSENTEKLHKCSYYTSLELKTNPFLKEEQFTLDFGEMEKSVRISEQLLLLLLILGRWFLPKGKLSHDQLSQLLLVYLGTAADIAEFFESFKDKTVQNNRMLCVMILGLWSWSLLQFSFVLTAARARKDQSGLLSGKNPSISSYTKYYQSENIPYLSVFSIKENKNKSILLKCCKYNWFSPDVYGIFISISLQDGPFLAFRLALIFRFDVVSYTNMFFTAKNSLVIILLVYRLIVVWCEQKKKIEIQEKNEKIPSLPPPQIVVKGIDRSYQNGFFDNFTKDNENPISQFTDGMYSCSDFNNQIPFNFKCRKKPLELNLQSIAFMKSEIDNNLFTIPLRDEIKLSPTSSNLNNSNNNSKFKNESQSIGKTKDRNTENNCSQKSVEIHNSSSSLNPPSSAEIPFHLFDSSSKIKHDIDMICNDAQNFLLKYQSKIFNENNNNALASF